MFFSTWKVSTRLGSGYAAIILFLLTIVAVSDASLRKTADATDYLLTQKLKNERLIGEWKSIIEVNAERSIAVGRSSDQETRKFFTEAIQRNSARASELQKFLDSNIKDPEARRLFDLAIAQRAIYQKLRAEALAKLENGHVDEAKAYFADQFPREAAIYVDSVEKLVQRQRELIDTTGRDIHAASFTTRLFVGSLTLAAILLALGIAYFIARSILRQLGGEPNYAAAITKKIALGDLSVKVETREGDQSSLLFDLKNMRDSLINIVTEVRAG
ncbi:MAG: MCP four helix bundle domain-containing protein, partial [Pseudomonadota bacterium]|nr:MCP four helix bundle domain-containing protein [Pseudomonadota bacterium]